MNDYVPFIDKRLYLRKTDLGYGIFTEEEIEENKFIEIAPVIICEKEIVKFTNLSNYIISWNGKVGVPLGWTMLYNHSDKNSCDFSSNYYENLLAIITNRKIKKDEQITVNYGSAWFKSRGIEKVQI